MLKKENVIAVLIIVLGIAMIGSIGCGKKQEEAGQTAPSDTEKTGEPLKVGAILAVTGPASFLGAPEANTLKMLTEEVNSKGGIDGHNVELVIKDSQGSPEKAISFAKQLIEEEKVTAIIGPSTSGETLKIKDICEKNKTILLSCAAAEKIVNPVATYVFKTPQKDSYAAKKIFQTMNEMSIKEIGVVVGNTGFGKAGKAQLEKYAPEYGIDIVISEVYDKKATDLTGVLTKVKGKGVEALVNWSIVPAQSILLKNREQIGMDIPVFQSHGFGNIKYVESAGKAAEGVIFPCGRLLAVNALPEDHPQKALLETYKENYESKFGGNVSTFGGHAYDAFIILREAVKNAGTIDTDTVRDAIENIKGLPGTGGIFSFSAEDHNGLGIDSFEMLTVKNGEFALFEMK